MYFVSVKYLCNDISNTHSLLHLYESEIYDY